MFLVRNTSQTSKTHRTLLWKEVFADFDLSGCPRAPFIADGWYIGSVGDESGLEPLYLPYPSYSMPNANRVSQRLRDIGDPTATDFHYWLRRLTPSLVPFVFQRDGRPAIIVPEVDREQPYEPTSYENDIVYAESLGFARVGYSTYTSVSDGTGRKIFLVVPLDHDRDGNTALWLCQGEHHKNGEWTLALQQEGSSSELFSFHDTGVACSRG